MFSKIFGKKVCVLDIIYENSNLHFKIWNVYAQDSLNLS